MRVSRQIQRVVGVGLIAERGDTVDPGAQLDAAVLRVEREHGDLDGARGLQFDGGGPEDDAVVFDEDVGALEEARGEVVRAGREGGGQLIPKAFLGEAERESRSKLIEEFAPSFGDSRKVGRNAKLERATS